MPNKSHLEVLSYVYEEACLAHSITRIVLSNTRGAGRNALHVAQMDYFGLVFKTLTAYKAITPEMLEDIQSSVRSYMSSLISVFKETVASRGEKNADILCAKYIVMSRYYFLYSYEPMFSSQTPRDPEQPVLRHQSLAVYAAGTRYNYLVEEAKIRYRRLLESLYKGDEQHYPTYIVTPDNIHLTPKTNRNRGGDPRTTWNHNAKIIVFDRSYWSRVLQATVGGIEAFERFTFARLGLDPKAIRVSYDPSKWSCCQYKADMKTHTEKGYARYKELEADVKTISPEDNYSAEFGSVVKLVRNEGIVAEDKFHPSLQVFLKEGKFYAQYVLNELTEITKNAEFAKVSPAAVENAGKHSGIYACANVSDVSACIAQANQDLKTAAEKQRLAAVEYSDWVKASAVKTSAIKKLSEVSRVLQGLTDDELSAVFSAEEIRKVGQILRKAAKVAK